MLAGRRERRWQRTVAGAAVLGVVAVVVPMGTPSQGVVPGANGRIVFTSDRDDPGCERSDAANRYCDFNIFSMNPDGTDVRRLTTDPAEDWEPAWSPDGTQIVFVTRRTGGSADIWIMDADGTNQRPLIELPGYDDEPVWSPDGTTIAWRHNLPDGNPEIFAMKVDGSAPAVNVSNQGGGDKEDLEDEPAWSPDGQMIIFRSDKGTGTTLWSMNAADGSDKKQLTTRYSDDPAFSPDGSRVAYRASGASGSSGAGIWTMSPDGTNQVRLPLMVDGIDPAWSPDGTKIAFLSRDQQAQEVERTSNGDIFVMNADGSSPVNLTNSPEHFDGDPDWQWLASGTPTTQTPPTTATTAPPGSEPTTTTTTATTMPPAAAPKATSGYAMVDDAGVVSAFGGAKAFGDAALPAGQPAVDLEYHPSGGGYWVLGTRGAVKAMGSAGHFGDASSRLVGTERATSLSSTPTGAGYWVFTDTGRALPFGDAAFLGDMSGTKLNGAVLDSVPTPTGKGYFMVASDGGIFTFGDAKFWGSTGDMKLNAPVQSLVPDPDGSGYWLVASDGGVFAFTAPFRGSMGGTRLNKPVTGMVAYGNGYLMVAEDGGIFNFSDRPFNGSLGDRQLSRPIVAVAPSGSSA